MKSIWKKVMSAGLINSLALLVVAQSANQACMWIFHQPELPESANALKKH